MKTIYATILLALMCCTTARAQYSVTLNPVQDAYFVTMGGGQGANTMLKFDISSLPAGANITSAMLQVYVWDTAGPSNSFSPAKLGNMRFMNLHGHQNWTESDSAKFFVPYQNTFSDTVLQLTGFGDTIGWTTSLNLKTIVDEDHLQLNQFCTIFMKDTDDVTNFNGPGTFLTNSIDSLITGNKMIGADQIMFYPREKANYMPRLTIMYMCPVDVTVQSSGNVITANEASGTYQWLDCGNGMAPIVGETGQSYTASTSGNYAVIVTKAGCSDTSVCTNINTMQVKNFESAARVYPNPVKDILNVDARGNCEVTLCDISGRVVYHTAVNGKVSVDMKNESKGLYLLKITGESEAKVIKVVKE